MNPTDTPMPDAGTQYADEEPESHRDYAWTFSGHAYNSKVPKTMQGMRLACLAPKAKQSTASAKPAPLQPTSTELATDNMPTTGTWIGMFIHAYKDTLKTVANKKLAIASSQNVKAIEKDDQALRVLVLEDAARTTTYALANPDTNGLCTPLVVPIESVFFFRKFRDQNDGLTAIKLRNKAWSDNIRALLPRSKDKVQHEGPRTVSLPRADALVTDVKRLHLGYNSSGQISYLKSLTKLLKNRLQIVEEDPRQSSVILHKALNTTSKFSFDQSEIQLLHSEILNHWPDLDEASGITPTNLAAMCKAVSLAEVTVDPMCNRSFIVLLCEQLDELPSQRITDNDHIAVLAEKGLRTVELMHGSQNPSIRPKSKISDEVSVQSVSETVKETIESILRAARDFDEKRKSEMGPIPYGATMQQLQERVLQSGDYDAMLAALNHARRLDLEDSLIRNDTVYRMLDELVVLLHGLSESD